MKKVIFGVSTAVIVAAIIGTSCMFSTGCSINPDTAKVVAYQAGKYTVLGWFIVDNPTPEVKATVKTIVSTIKDSAALVSPDKTYLEVILPIIMKDVIPKVPINLQPICTAGAISVLGGLDMLFAYKPEWKQDVQKAVVLVGEYCRGADESLSMSDNDPIYKAVVKASVERTKLNVDQRGYIKSFQK